MQFYIIRHDPSDNARALPDYAILQVNVREGYTMLSDIGHRFGVTWEGQRKAYNPNHPWTRRFSYMPEFDRFLRHWSACCDEYPVRAARVRALNPRSMVKDTRQEIELGDSPGFLEAMDLLSEHLPPSECHETLDYLVHSKSDKLVGMGSSLASWVMLSVVVSGRMSMNSEYAPTCVDCGSAMARVSESRVECGCGAHFRKSE